jgi:HEAT repeat protein
MKRLLVIAAILLTVSGAAAQDLDALIARMGSADEAQRTAAIQAIVPAGASALPRLFRLIDGYNRYADVNARRAIEEIVYRASAPGAPDREAVARALAEIAASPGQTSARRYALQMISFVGSGEVVPALALLLPDWRVGEMALYALVRIPDPAAGQAILGAVPGARGSSKAALITALGVRGDPAAAPIVRAALDDRNESIRLAAIEALGGIPSPDSEPTLRNLLSRPGREGRAARDAYLRLADALLAAGRRGVAAGMYEQRLAAADSEQEKCAALRGLAKANGERAVPRLLNALAGHRAAVAGAAAASLETIPGEKATRQIAAAVAPARPEVRLRLIEILGRRKDPAALPALFAAMKSGRDARASAAAAQALGEIGEVAAVPALAAAAGSGEATVSAAAVTALAQLPGAEATAAVIQAMESAPAKARPTLVRVLGYRRDAQAGSAVIAAIGNRDSAVRLAAIQAAGDLAEPAATPALLEVLRGGSAAERAAAVTALGQIRTPGARRQMAAAYDGAPAPVRADLLHALGQRPAAELLPFFIRATKEADEPVVLAGLEALGNLRDEKAAPVFQEAARAESPKVRAMAVHGYLQLGTGWFDKDREQAVAMSRLALQLPAADEDRKAALGAIFHFGDVDSLPLVTPLLQNPALGRDAAWATLAISDNVAKADKAQAIALCRQLLGVIRDGDLLNATTGRLRDWGVDVDLARDGGFITHWWVLGPFAGAERLMKTDLIPTGGAVDLSRKVPADNQTFEWKPVRVEDAFGMLDLIKTAGPQDDGGAYVYAEVTSDSARDILLKVGSDDDFVCWLNGKQVSAFAGGRGYAPDQDVVKARLQAGTNTVLLKVLNRGGDWAAGVRLTDPSGQPLILKQRQP